MPRGDPDTSHPNPPLSFNKFSGSFGYLYLSMKLTEASRRKADSAGGVQQCRRDIPLMVGLARKTLEGTPYLLFQGYPREVPQISDHFMNLTGRVAQGSQGSGKITMGLLRDGDGNTPFLL